jgi:hypothetical protein
MDHPDALVESGPGFRDGASRDMILTTENMLAPMRTGRCRLASGAS